MPQPERATAIVFDAKANMIDLACDGGSAGAWEAFQPDTAFGEGDWDKVQMMVECAYFAGKRSVQIPEVSTTDDEPDSYRSPGLLKRLIAKLRK